MRTTHGTDVKVSTDKTGGFVSVDWHCPYCGEYNAGFYFSSDAETMESDFVVEEECDECGKMVSIECCDAEDLF